MKKFLAWSYITVCILTLSGHLLAGDENRVRNPSAPLFENILVGTGADYQDPALFRSLALSEREKQFRSGHNPEISEEREEEEVRRQVSSKRKIIPDYFFIALSCGTDYFVQHLQKVSGPLRYYTFTSSTRQHIQLRVFRI